jgi:TolB-like protein/tetratricopeptide (TPR) repeat protein
MRDYFDDTLLYCLDDGKSLVNGPTQYFEGAASIGSSEPRTLLYREVGATKPDIRGTIAVLPFANLSGDPGNEYFCDGLAEELLNVLSKIRGLRVAARTSAFSFKGKQVTVEEIGRILQVGSVLEGSIRIAGRRVRIAVQLVKVSDGYHIWSESYDRMMNDIFAVQDDIARAVVDELRSMLVGQKPDADSSALAKADVEAAIKGRTVEPEAQRLMLMGRYFLDRTTLEDTTKAIQYFRDALELDPKYALCWAELGRAYSIEAGRAWVPVEEGFERSRDATTRALVLEPDLAEGHAQLGRIRAAHDWNLRGAEESYRRAMELAPGSASVVDGAAMLAYKLGRYDEALALGREILQQDPLSAAYWHNLGLICHSAELLDESERSFRNALDLVPQRFVTSALLALVLLDQRRTEEALDQASNEPYEVWRVWATAIIQYLSGDTAGSDASLNILTEEHSIGNAYQIAEVHSMRGEKRESFLWLEHAFNERDPGLTHIKVNPRFRPLHDDKRWPLLLRKIGFDDVEPVS